MEEGVTCSQFRRRRVVGKPAYSQSGIWYFWFTHSYVATLKPFLKGRYFSIRHTHTHTYTHIKVNQILYRADFLAS